MATFKKKLLFITGTRAEYGLTKATLLKFLKSKKIELKILATGMHTLKKYGYTLKEIKKDFKVDSIVPIKESDDMLAALTKEIDGIKNYVQKEKVNAIMVAGDRDETFAGSVVGIHLNLPVIHVSGGDVSGPSVDHYLRNAMTVFSKLHLVQTPKAAKNVVALGANPNNIHVVGSLGLDGLNPDQLVSRQETAENLKINPQKPWYMIAHHPTPFEKKSFQAQIRGVLQAAKKLEPQSEKIIVYPNSDEGSGVFISEIEKLKNKTGYHLFRNLGRPLFLSAMYHSLVLIGNSSSGLFEAGYLRKPFVHVGNRQKGRERGVNVIDCSYQPTSILKAIKLAASSSFQNKLKKTPPLYQGGLVSEKVVKIIEQFLYEKVS